MGMYFEQFTPEATFRTPGRTITEGDIGTFAGLTGDYNPVHTDAVFAAGTQFGTRIAHGPFGIGLAFGLASRLDLIDGTVIALLSVAWEFKATGARRRYAACRDRGDRDTAIEAA